MNEKPQPPPAERAFEAHDTQQSARADGEPEARPDAPESPPVAAGLSPTEGAEEYAARHSDSTAGYRGASRRPVDEPSDDPSGAG